MTVDVLSRDAVKFPEKEVLCCEGRRQTLHCHGIFRQNNQNDGV